MKRGRRRRGAAAGALLVAIIGATACAPVKSGPPTGGVLMVGDSIAFELVPPLSWEVGSRGKPFNSASIPGCSALGGLPAHDDGVYTYFDWAPVCANVWGAHEENLAKFRPRVVVWMSVIETYPLEVDGTWIDPCCPPTPEAEARLMQLLEAAYQHFVAHGAGLILVTMPPPTSTKDELPTRMSLLNDRLRQFAATHPDVGLVDLAAMACPGGIPCPEYVGGIYLREADGIHFSDQGAAWAASVVGPRVIVA